MMSRAAEDEHAVRRGLKSRLLGRSNPAFSIRCEGRLRCRRQMVGQVLENVLRGLKNERLVLNRQPRVLAVKARERERGQEHLIANVFQCVRVRLLLSDLLRLKRVVREQSLVVGDVWFKRRSVPKEQREDAKRSEVLAQDDQADGKR